MSRKTRKRNRNQFINREQKTVPNTNLQDIENATASAQNQPQNGSVPPREQQEARANYEGDPTGSTVGNLALLAKQSSEKLAKADAQASQVLVTQAAKSGRNTAKKAELARAAGYLDQAVQDRIENTLILAASMDRINNASEAQLIESIGDVEELQNTDISAELGKLQALSSSRSNTDFGATLTLFS